MTGGAVEIRGAIGKAGDRGAVRSELAGSRQGHPRIAAVMALALAAGVWGVATLAPHRMGLPALLGLGAAALVGLIFSLGVVAGFVHIGRLPRQRVFFDGLLDAVADPCVVTDLRGRVVYANEPYRQLLSAVGLNRLVGVERNSVFLPARPPRWRARTSRPGSAPRSVPWDCRRARSTRSGASST
jgi:PAS domain-containing protein